MLDTIAYSSATGSLWVKFKPSGLCYSYAGVGQTIANELKNATSHGQYFNNNIKGIIDHTNESLEDFLEFCRHLKNGLVPVPIVNINWDVVAADGDYILFGR
jgi:hypothetical protein